jgi:hypothetical protein
LDAEKQGSRAHKIVRKSKETAIYIYIYIYICIYVYVYMYICICICILSARIGRHSHKSASSLLLSPFISSPCFSPFILLQCSSRAIENTVEGINVSWSAQVQLNSACYWLLLIWQEHSNFESSRVAFVFGEPIYKMH